MECCISECSNTTEKISGITFHKLPSAKDERAAWLRALGLPCMTIPAPLLVCSEHFKKEDIEEYRQIRRGAVPIAAPQAPTPPPTPATESSAESSSKSGCSPSTSLPSTNNEIYEWELQRWVFPIIQHSTSVTVVENCVCCADTRSPSPQESCTK